MSTVTNIPNISTIFFLGDQRWGFGKVGASSLSLGFDGSYAWLYWQSSKKPSIWRWPEIKRRHILKGINLPHTLLFSSLFRVIDYLPGPFVYHANCNSLDQSHIGILRELRDNMASVDWRKNYHSNMVHFLFLFRNKLFVCQDRQLKFSPLDFAKPYKISSYSD